MTAQPADAVSEMDAWEAMNSAYLAAGLAWTRERLGAAGDPGAAERWWETGQEAEPAAALELLGDRLGLSRFERLVLMLAAATELDPTIAARCAEANGNPLAVYPTLALALAVLPGATWDVVSPQRPLRYWRLIELDEPRAGALTATRIRIDERIVSFLKGLNVMDERLAPFISPVAAELPVNLPATHERAVAEIVVALTEERNGGRPPAIELVGVDPAMRRGLAASAAQRLGRELYEVTPERVPPGSLELSDLTRLWERETLLLPVLLYADTAEVPREGTAGIDALLEQVRGHVLMGCREPRPLRSRRLRVVDTPRPTAGEQQALWQELLAGDAQTASRLASEFDLGQLVIADVVGQVQHSGAGVAGLWAACRAQTRPRLDTLARRIEPVARWDDLVLPDAELTLLHHIVDQVRGRATVLRSWGLAERVTRGSAVTALFAGGSGTGKTLAAEVIAHELELDMYRVDLAGVVSKYIGETEQNLRRVFDAAEEGGTLLMFDEADALFGKRSEVKDSHDRYANIEVGYLLQRMESFEGLAVLTTNMKSALDKAFQRRLRFIVDFPFPDAAQREAIWKRVFPADTPTEALDAKRLSSLNMAGGSIRNIALNAAFLAARRGAAVGMSEVLEATRGEAVKTERPLVESEIRGWV